MSRTPPPPATTATAGRIVVELTNGCTFAFPPALAQGLEAATPAQLAQIEILGPGYGLHWEALNADLSIPGLLSGIFGTKAYMARRAGQTGRAARRPPHGAMAPRAGVPARACAADSQSGAQVLRELAAHISMAVCTL